jgi:hypothetical protein
VITTDVPGAPLAGLKLVITGVTLNVPDLVAVPPGVVIAIFPVFEPLGTFAVTCCVAELIETTVAFTPPNVTLDVCVNPVPEMTMEVPMTPLAGMKLAMAGMTLKTLLLTSGPAGVTRVTFAVVPVAGTTVCHKCIGGDGEGRGARSELNTRRARQALPKDFDRSAPLCWTESSARQTSAVLR